MQGYPLGNFDFLVSRNELKFCTLLKVNFRQILKNFYIFLMNWRYGGMNFRSHFDQIIPAAKFRITFTLKCVSSLRTHIHKLYAQS